MALATQPWTRADLHRLPDDGNRYEVLDGELLVTPPPSAEHQDVVEWLAEKLFPFVQTHRLGKLSFPRSIVVIDGSQLEPDLMVRPTAPGRRWEDRPLPTLVVEVLSSSTRRRDLGHKRAFYMEKGIPEYWAVDRDKRAVVRVTRSSIQTVTSLLTWTPPGVSATLTIDIAAMFEELTP